MNLQKAIKDNSLVSCSSSEQKSYTLNQSPLDRAKRIKQQISIEKMKYMINSPLLKKCSPKNLIENLSSSEKQISFQNPQNSQQKVFISAFDRIQALTAGKKDYQRSPIRRRQKQLALTDAKYQIDYMESRRKIYNFAHQYQKQEDQCQNFESDSSSKSKKYVEKSTFKTKFHYSETISTNSSTLATTLGINDFKLGKQIGAGKFGQVFIGMHKKSGFVCAIKRINKLSLDSVLKKQLIREIKIQTYLNHPNIVKLYTFFSDEQCIYLVLELCTSGQLYHFLKRKKNAISEQLGKVILRQVCQGLDYIHQNNIIHRDLKPQNILYHNGMMKICDFGWSIDTEMMRDTFCGTPLYLSPQLLKRNNYDSKIDSWSLGVLAYQILIGKVPFEIYSESDYIKIIKNQVKLSSLVGLSQQAKDFIISCLEKQPKNRLTVHQMLSHPFLQKVQVINFPEIF